MYDVNYSKLLLYTTGGGASSDSTNHSTPYGQSRSLLFERHNNSRTQLCEHKAGATAVYFCLMFWSIIDRSQENSPNLLLLLRCGPSTRTPPRSTQFMCPHTPHLAYVSKDCSSESSNTEGSVNWAGLIIIVGGSPIDVCFTNNKGVHIIRLFDRGKACWRSNLHTQGDCKHHACHAFFVNWASLTYHEDQIFIRKLEAP